MKRWLIPLMVLGLANSAAAKSVYIAANHHTRAFEAWNIAPDGTVTKQATYTLQHATDPAGVAIHNSKNLLFLTSEFSGGVEILDPVTLTYYGVSSGPSNLAGIDVDDLQDIVYTVRRATKELYVYKWNDATKKLDLIATVNLPNCTGAMGIALDEIRGILWVADSYHYDSSSGLRGMVRAYDLKVADPSLISEDIALRFRPNHVPIDIEVDRKRQAVYTVSMFGGAALPSGSGSYLLSKWDVASKTETTIIMAAQGVGLAVDEVSGYVYVTHGANIGDNLTVWNPSTSPFANIQTTAPIGHPAGLAIGNVSFNPLSLAKNDTVQGSGVYIGQTFTYEISFTNPNPFPINNVTVLDTLPVELDYVSSTPAGTYDSTAHTVTWNFGTVMAGVTVEIDLVVKVNDKPQVGTTIYNYCTVDSDETPPTTVIGTDPDNPGGDPGNVVIEPPLVSVSVDIRPGSCPNPLNEKDQGVLPVAIAGTPEFDVTEIDPSSVMLTREGLAVSVPALRRNFEDAATPYIGPPGGCHTLRGDGIVDLIFHFSTSAVVKMLKLDEVARWSIVPLKVTGKLREQFGGKTIEGVDYVRVQ
jgi:uncharacterized repeat protein (TIGR01451 family)